MTFVTIYTTICIVLKYVCRCYQTAGRKSCSIVSGDVSKNCLYRLTAHPVTSSRLSSAEKNVYAKNTQNYREYRVAHATVYLNEAATVHSAPAKRGR